MIRITAYCELLSGILFFVCVTLKFFNFAPEIYEITFTIHKNFKLVPFSLNWIVVMTQIYEYSFMIYGIVFQNGKSMVQALKMFENPNVRKKFKKGETIIKYTYYVSVTLIIAINFIIKLIKHIKTASINDLKGMEVIDNLRDLAAIFALLFTGFLILFMLKKRYNEEY